MGHVVLDAGQNTKFTFHRDIMLMGVIDNLAGQFGVFGERKMRAVDHDG